MNIDLPASKKQLADGVSNDEELSRNDVVKRGARVLPSPSRRGLPADACVFTKWLLASGGPKVLGETRALPDPIAWFRLRGSQTVLIVDDEELILTGGQTVLSTYGNRVLMATNGAGALKAFEDPEAAMDLLISDLVMPQMSGREQIGTARKRAPAARVLMCSGFVQPTQIDDELYLKKPFTSQQLLQKVKQVLG